MSIKKLNCVVYIDTDKTGDDLESTVWSFANGLYEAIKHFPEAEIITADVESASDVSEEEANEQGLLE